MEQKETSKILDSIENVYLKSKNSELKPAIFQKLNDDLEILSNYFKSTEKEAFFLAFIFNFNLEHHSLSISDLARNFSCSHMHVLRYKFILDSLLHKNLVTKQYTLRRDETEYLMNKSVFNAIIEKREIPVEIEAPLEDIFDFLEKLYELTEQRSDYKITFEELLSKTETLLEKYKDFPLLKITLALQLPIVDTYYLLLTLWKKISDNQNLVLEKIAKNIFDKEAQKTRYIQSLINGTNKLVENDLVILQVENHHRYSEIELSLSASSLKMMNESGIKSYDEIKTSIFNTRNLPEF